MPHAVVAVSVVLRRDIHNAKEEGGVARTWRPNPSPKDGGGTGVCRLCGVRIEGAGGGEASDCDGFMVVKGTAAFAL